MLVAVVDSGVDPGRPELSGRVLHGADVPQGNALGSRDCTGSGTAMAVLVAGESVVGRPAGGVAPQAGILPVRVVHEAEPTAADDVVSGIVLAVAAGVKVIAIGAAVDVSIPAVVEALNAAVAHGVLVVLPARTATGHGPAAGTAGPSATARPGILRVGAVGRDNRPVAPYVPNGVDLVAPGVDVSGPDLTGSGPRSFSGSEYAVAFVAGAAALVRSAHPGLGPAEVAQRLTASADPQSTALPDPGSGWGMVDPASAVGDVAEIQLMPSTGPSRPDDFGPLIWTAVLGGLGLAAVGLLTVTRLRHRRRGRVAAGSEPPQGAGPEPSTQGITAGGDPP
ncbi:S8 family serine peptidase [Micromonospora sp. NPDC050200]|uniref:S8 family serine peptidase n=1 Tax=Micromonospora sp. NPDC050200 TaxID=3155664 RepID=UPI0034041CB5